MHEIIRAQTKKKNCLKNDKDKMLFLCPKVLNTHISIHGKNRPSVQQKNQKD